MGEFIVPAGGLQPGQVVLLGSLPRIPKLGRCVASSAPRAMVRDLAQHEGLHPRRNDCFSWSFDASASADAYQRQLEEAIKLKLEEAVDQSPAILSGPATLTRCTYPNRPCICTGMHNAVIDVEPVDDESG